MSQPKEKQICLNPEKVTGFVHPSEEFQEEHSWMQSYLFSMAKHRRKLLWNVGKGSRGSNAWHDLGQTLTEEVVKEWETYQRVTENRCQSI